MPVSVVSSSSSQSFGQASESSAGSSSTALSLVDYSQQNLVFRVQNFFYCIYGHLARRRSPKAVAIFFAAFEFLQIFAFGFDDTGSYDSALESHYGLSVLAKLRTFRAIEASYATHEAIMWIAFVYIACWGAMVFAKARSLKRGEDNWDRVSTVFRYCLLFFAYALYVPFLSYVLALVACRFSASGDGMLAFFPGELCYGPLGIVNVVIGSAVAAGLVIVGFLSHALFYAPLYSRDEVFSMASSRLRLGLFVVKTVLVGLYTLIPGLQGTIPDHTTNVVLLATVLLCNCYLLAYLLYALPFHRLAVNFVAVALMSVSTMNALMHVALPLTDTAAITALIAWLVVLPVAAALGVLACWLRASRSGLKIYGGLRSDVDEIRFVHELDVEFATRFAYGHKDEATLEKALAIYAHGVETFPAEASVRIAQCVFMCTHLEEHQLLQVNINRVRRLPMAWDQAYILFCVDTLRRALVREQDGGLEEITARLQRASKYEDECKRFIRAFWRHLSREEDLNALPEIVSSIDKNEKQANEIYLQMLQQFPKSARVLRAYGAFLEEIMNDAELAAVAYRGADALEEERTQQQRKRLHKQKKLGKQGSVEKKKHSKSALKSGKDIDAEPTALGSGEKPTEGKRARFETVEMETFAMSNTKEDATLDDNLEDHKAEYTDDLEQLLDAKADLKGNSRLRRSELVRQARFRKRIELSRSSALEKMLFAKRITALVFLIDVITIFVAARVIVDQFATAQTNFANAGQLTPLLTGLAMSARGMNYAAFRNDSTAFTEQRRLLISATEQIEALTTALLPSITGNTSIVWNDKFTNRVDFLPPYGNLSGIKSTTKTGLWDLGVALTDSAYMVADTAPSIMANAGVFPAFRFIWDNYFALIQGVLQVRAVYQAKATSVVETLRLTLYILTPISLAILIVVAIAGVRPAINRLIRERTDALKLFTAIPKQTVAQICDKLSGESDDMIKDHEEEIQDDREAIAADAEVEISAGSGSLPIVREVRNRFIVVTVVSCVVILGMFTVGMIFIGGSGYTPAQVNMFYSLRSLMKRQQLWSRELYFFDSYSWANRAAIITSMKAPTGASRLVEYFDQVKWGDQGMDVPPAVGNPALEYTLFIQRCSLPNSTVKCRGASTLMQQVMTDINNIIAFPPPQYNSSNPFLLDLEAMLGDSVADLEVTSGPGEICRMFISMANYIRGRQKAFVEAVDTAHLVLFVLCFPLTALGFIFLNPYEGRIKEENSRTMKMLLMIPVNVIDQVPAIKEYLDTGRQENAQMRLKDAYEEAVARTQSILNASVDGIIVVNTDRLIESCNPAAERTFGYKEEEMKGKAGSMLLADSLTHTISDMMDHYMSTGEAASLGEVRELKARRQDGSVFPITFAMSASTVNSKVLFAIFVRDISAIKENERLLTREKEKSEKLLQSMLPASIAEQIKEDGIDGSRHLIAEGYKEVTVLFADMVKFTNLSSTLSPSELVFLLNQLFSTWDLLAQKHKLEKIKTIGDCYMVAGGLPERSIDHTMRMMEFAIDMLDSLKAFNREHGRDIDVRIGINVGPVVAGVIGLTKITYDLWGDAVNVASRMESSGVAGRIQVSHKAFELLNGSFLFEERGKMEIKGKGAMLTYLYKDRRFIRTESGHVVRRATLTPPPGAAGFFTNFSAAPVSDTNESAPAESSPVAQWRRGSTQSQAPPETGPEAAPRPTISLTQSQAVVIRSDSELIRELSTNSTDL
eukprot:TRINITY_DN4101_c0_g5_i1.p1 TRINITY_DN4101_c0_g5~~TRINITY_DN4101_c0_g5_i1.p1  ORF type:complete len:1724 (+),score=505.03 TRINITY_DN4101_c0_g5_i1:87-5258(+)